MEIKLLTAQEFAELYKIHPKTVYRLGREGTLQTKRVGKSVRFIEPEEERVVRNGKRVFE